MKVRFFVLGGTLVFGLLFIFCSPYFLPALQSYIKVTSLYQVTAFSSRHQRYFSLPPLGSKATLFQSNPTLHHRPERATIRTLEDFVYNEDSITSRKKFTLLRNVKEEETSPYHAPRFCNNSKDRTPWLLEFRGVWMNGKGDVLVPEKIEKDVVLAKHYSIGGGCCSSDWKSFSKSTVQATGCRHHLAFSLAQNHGATPWHIINDVLPRMIAFWNTTLDVIQQRGVIVTDDYPVPTNFIHRIGIPRRYIAQVRGLCYFDCLIIPAPFIQGRYPHSCFRDYAMRLVAEQYLADAPPLPKRPLVLLIDRALARRKGKCTGTRCMANFPELRKEIANEFGNSITLKTLPHNAKNLVRTSAILFHQATVVVGMHGGGMVNIMFMLPENTTVIHFGWEGPNSGVNKIYARLAKRKEVPFRNVITKGMSHTRSNVKIDIPVAILEIRRALQRSGFEVPQPRMKTDEKMNSQVVQSEDDLL